MAVFLLVCSLSGGSSSYPDGGEMAAVSEPTSRHGGHDLLFACVHLEWNDSLGVALIHGEVLGTDARPGPDLTRGNG